MSKRTTPTCSACGAEAEQGLANLMPCGEDSYLCRDCAETMLRCFAARGSPGTALSIRQAVGITIPSPSELVSALNLAVIGQDVAKRLLSVALWKHLQRCHGNTAAPKAHVLLYGPTGCGKTHLARTAAKLMDVPFVGVDATTFSETGYKGRDIRDIVWDVLDAADGDRARAEHAVVFVDEFDKLAASGGEARAAYQHGTQHGFLTMLEGAPVTVERGTRTVTFDPSGLLFIFAGAFGGIEENISERLHCGDKPLIGFGRKPAATAKTEADALLPLASPEDFVQYGIEAELIGRIPVLAPILPLTEGELVRILTEANGSICAQYTAFFEALGVNFSVSDTAAELLAREAHASGSGARGLRGHLERAVTDLLFRLPAGSGIHITPEVLRKAVSIHESECADGAECMAG